MRATRVMLGTRNISKEDVVKWKTENKKGLLGSFRKQHSSEK
jgi:hypothetical protein